MDILHGAGKMNAVQPIFIRLGAPRAWGTVAKLGSPAPRTPKDRGDKNPGRKPGVCGQQDQAPKGRQKTLVTHAFRPCWGQS